MTILQDKAVKYILSLSNEKLTGVVDYLQYLSEQEIPLDNYDYELAKQADEDLSTEVELHEDLCKRLGINT